MLNFGLLRGDNTMAKRQSNGSGTAKAQTKATPSSGESMADKIGHASTAQSGRDTSNDGAVNHSPAMQRGVSIK